MIEKSIWRAVLIVVGVTHAGALGAEPGEAIVEWLESPVDPPPALAPEAADRVEELEHTVSDLRDQGKYREAIPLAKEALSLRRRGQGDAWWETADARHRLATLETISALSDDAQRQLAEVEKLEKRILALAGRGKYAEGLSVLDGMLDVRKRLLGSNHVDTAWIIKSRAYFMDKLGRYAEAVDAHRDALAILRAVLGDSHPEMGNSCVHLAALERRFGRFTQAERLLREAYVVQRAAYGDAHHEVVTVLNILGLLMRDLGRYAEAEHVFLRALDLGKQLGTRHVSVTTTTLNNLAGLYQRRGEFRAAQPLYVEALAVRRRFLGVRREEVAASLNNLGGLLQRVGDFEAAERRYRQALAVRRKSLPPEHPKFGISLANVGSVLARRGADAEAVSFLREALRILEKGAGRDSLTASTVRHKLARSLRRSGDPAGAEAMCRSSLAAFRATLGPDHSYVGHCLTTLADILADGADEARYDEAESHYVKAIAILRAAEDPRMNLAMTAYGDLLLRRNRPDAAIAAYAEAVAQIESRRSSATGDELDHSRFYSVLAEPDATGGMIRAQLASSPSTTTCGDEAAALGPCGAYAYLERDRGRALLDLLDRGGRKLEDLGRSLADRRGDPALRLAIEEIHQRRIAANARILSATEAIKTLEADRGEATSENRDRRIAAHGRRRKEAQRAHRQTQRELFELVRGELDRSGLEPWTPKRIAAMLEPGELLLAYDIGRDDSILLVVHPAGRVSGHALRWRDGANVDAKSLNVAVQRDFDRLSRGDKPAGVGDTSHAHDENELLAALVPDLVRAAVDRASRVLIVPDGPLHLLPFEALMIADHPDRRSLDVGPAIIYGPSGTILMDRRLRASRRAGQARRAGRMTLVALGDPAFARRVESRTVPAAGVPDHGCLVIKVVPDSNASRHGIRLDDVLLSYDRVRLEAPGDLSGAIRATRERKEADADKQNADAESQSARQRSAIPIRVWRRGEILDLSVDAGRLGVALSPSPAPSVLGELPCEYLPWEEPAPLAAVGNGPGRGDRLARLPGTLVEVHALAALAERSSSDSDAAVRLLTGAGATTAALFEAAPSARFLHLATHGLVGDGRGARQSALAMAPPIAAAPGDDGHLRLDDLLYDWGGRLEGTELVTLSACRTARGRLEAADGFVALTWGFLFAGAESVVASLWKVDDTATALLMSRFYENLLGVFREPRVLGDRTFAARTPMPKAEALFEAKCWLRRLPASRAERLAADLFDHARTRGATFRAKPTALAPDSDYPYVDPFYWAAFILIGDGS